MSIIKLFKSFGYAISGIGHTIKTEQNMRIHLSVANLIVAFAYFYKITRAEWAMLFISIAAVLFAETINTSIERLADAQTSEYCESIKHAKDVAAGGVTIFCIAALLVGVALFLDIDRIVSTLTYIFSTPGAFLVCAGFVVADTVFLIFGGEKKKRKDISNEGK